MAWGGSISASCCLNTSSFSWVFNAGDRHLHSPSQWAHTQDCVYDSCTHTWGRGCAAPSTHSLKHILHLFLFRWFILIGYGMGMYPHLPLHAPCHASRPAQFKHNLKLNWLQIACDASLSQPRIDQEVQIKPFTGYSLCQSGLFKSQSANYSLQSEN